MKFLRVDLNNTEVVDKLTPIPGLKFSWENSCVRGMNDAVDAASRVLGQGGIAPLHEPQKYTGTLPLKDYQRAGVERLAGIMMLTGGALLADDMGLGKTLQTIALAQHLGSRRILIICPRFMSFGWVEELTKWGEVESTGLVRPGMSDGVWALASKCKWLITSYEMAEQTLQRAYSSSLPEFVAFDEAHMIKNTGAGRTQIAKDIATLVPFKLAITATPMWSRPKDFYGILSVLLGSRFGSRTSFFLRYGAGRINEHGGLEAKGSSNEEELKRRLTHYMVRREKKDVLKELPSLTRQIIWLPPDEEGTKALKAAVLNKRANAAYQACSAVAKAKMELAVSLALQAKRFILFTYEKKHAQELAKKIDLQGGKVVCVTGDLSVDKRQSLIQVARSSGGGIVATIDSLGAGVNLQGVASTGIMHVLDWVPLKLAQAEARIHRLGQTDPVHWYYLAVKESMDEIIVKNIVEKLDQWRSVIGHGSNRNLRDDLAGGEGEEAEAAALKAIYENM